MPKPRRRTLSTTGWIVIGLGVFWLTIAAAGCALLIPPHQPQEAQPCVTFMCLP